ncbi:MAG: hypothetical protein J6R26_07870 [Paludibacteraceae bacterium]|nr:hypothetical protein [Paludibacteraceae bacterium]
MKRTYYIAFLCLGLLTLSTHIGAQDVQRFAERSPIGTARYVGMGGAMTAIGGDPSAALDNPAGLALYRHCEFSVSLDETIDQTMQNGGNYFYQRSRLMLPQASVVWASGNPDKQRGLIFSNFMLTINRLHSYNRDVSVSGNNFGLIPTICTKTNLLPESQLQNLPWNNEDIGWLSILGYEGFLINPAANDQWVPALDLPSSSLEVHETGYSDQYTLSWAGNINNQWYLGASLNIPNITYRKEMSLYQSNGLNNAELKSAFHASGVGVSGSFGVIGRPTQWLRLGISVHTPTALTLTVQTEGDIYSNINNNSYEVLTPASGAFEVKYASPLRTSASIAFQLKHLGLLSFQYDYAHALREKKTQYQPMEDVHTLRTGLEVQVCKGVFLNAGYVYESSFLNTDPIVELTYNTIRTDTDYRYTQFSQYASAGIGYRSDFLVAHVAYQYGWQLLHQYATECHLYPIDVATNTHRIVATLAWRL